MRNMFLTMVGSRFLVGTRCFIAVGTRFRVSWTRETFPQFEETRRQTT